MNPVQRFPINLDSVAGLVTGFFLLLISLVVWLGSQIGIRVSAGLPEDASVGPFESLTLNFSEPVDGNLTVAKFSIQPVMDGKFTWVDDKTLQFEPREPFQPDTDYTMTLAPGALTRNGRLLKKSDSWNFRVRPPRVVYLVAEGGKSRLWTIEPDGGQINPLTDDSFTIFDFDTSRDGNLVIFSAFNEQKGIDLWRVGRAGGNSTLLLQCGADRCSVPAISPDGRRVAYVREAAAPSPGLAFGSPRIWVLDLKSRQDASLYEDQQIIGYSPTWSPDGTWLSSFDGMADEIRLLDLVTSNQLIIPSQTGNPFTWSADGSTFVYTDVESNESGLHTRIQQAKLSTKEIVTLFGEKDERDYHYSSLAWSPAGDQLVLGLQFEANNPAEALWLIDPASHGGQVIADQPDYIYNNPFWDPWGRALVFQQFKLKGAYKPQISLWMPGYEEPRFLVEGILPHWLP